MNTPEARLRSLDRAESPIPRAEVDPLPDGLVDWLQPWRAPEDCLNGGLAISRSAEVLLKNVEAARQASMQQLYGLRDGRGTSAAGNISPRGTVGGASGRSSLAMKSVSAQRRSRVGMTLLDLASCPSSRRSSIFLPDAASPASGTAASVFPATTTTSSVRPVSSRWSAAGDREELAGGFDSVRVSPNAVTPLMAAAQGSSPLSMYSASHRGDVSPLLPCPSGPHIGAPSASDGRQASVPAIPRFDQFMRDKEVLLKVLEKDPLPPPRRGASDARPSPPVPPLDAEVAAAVEAPEAPETYTLELASHSGEDGQEVEEVEEVEEEEEEDSLSPPHPGGGGNRTARPLHRPSVALSELAPQQDGPLAFPRLRTSTTDTVDRELDKSRSRTVEEAVEDSWLSRRPTNSSPEQSHEEDAPEFDEELNASEHNFGEGGHLACVPGDTLNNRYVLLKQLGVGRSSRVWMAVDLEQCSIARRQLIRVVGESLVRELANPKDRPLFVAIKVFRCGDMYSACAQYEVKVLNYINERVKVQSVQKHFSLGHRGRPASATSTAQPSPARRRSTTGAPVPALDDSLHSSTRHSAGAATPSASASVPVSASAAAVAAAQALTGGISVACAKGNFTVQGDHGTHHGIVMDVLGTGVDAAINETSLRGVPLPIVRSIILSTAQGLATLASMSIVHTDLKPENLLFVDLDVKAAAEMEAFQASHLGLTLQGGLWTGFTHRRLTIPEYVEALAQQQQARQEGGEDGSSPTRGRVLFKVQVADLGLSFVVPPVLRSGVAQLMALGGPDTVAQTPAAQIQLIRDHHAAAMLEDHEEEEEEGSSLSASCNSHSRSRALLSNDSASSSAVTPARGRRSIGRAAGPALSSLTTQSSSPTQSKPTPVHVERVSVFHLPDEGRRSHSSAIGNGNDMGGGGGSGRDGLLGESISSLESDGPRPTVSAVPGDRRFTQLDVAASYDRSGLSSVLVSRADNDGDTHGLATPPSEGDAQSVSAGSEGAPTFVSIAAADPQAVAQTASYHSPPHAGASLATPGMSASMRMRERRRREKEEQAGQVGQSRQSEQAVSPADSPSGRATRGVIRRGSQRRLARRRSGATNDAGAEEGGGGGVDTLRLSDLYSCIVVPPTELEMDILQQQNYARGAVVQSREYRSPEVLLGDFFLPSCDVWSLGCIAYELVVGRFLFDATTEYNEVMNALIEMERDRRRDDLRRERRALQRGSLDGGSSHASLSISGRVSKWLDGFRSSPSAGAGGAAVSDLGDSFGRRTPAEKSGPVRQTHQAVALSSHSDSDVEDAEDAEVHGAARGFRWVDGIEDNKSKGSRSSPAAVVPGASVGYDSLLRGERAGDGARYDSDDADEEEEEESIYLNSEEEEEVLMAVHGVYFDEYEKDVDVFHLKCMMRLVGPPPLGYLRREPEGVYLRDFFDEKGVFLFYDDQAAEEKEYGIDQLHAVLHRERQRVSQMSPVVTVHSAVGNQGEDSPQQQEGPPITYDSLFRPSHVSVSSASSKASPAVGPVVLAAAAAALHSPISADLLSGSATPSLLSLPLAGSDNSAGSGHVAELLRPHPSGAPLSTANYSVVTPAWRQLQRDIRRTMEDESEAVAFETLLRQCLQWDPARRPDAASLLQSPWLIAFGDLARE